MRIAPSADGVLALRQKVGHRLHYIAQFGFLGSIFHQLRQARQSIPDYVRLGEGIFISCLIIVDERRIWHNRLTGLAEQITCREHGPQFPEKTQSLVQITLFTGELIQSHKISHITDIAGLALIGVYVFGGVAHLSLQRLHHARIACLFIGHEEAVVTFGAEVYGVVRAPHVEFVQPTDIVISGSAGCAWPPPDGQVMDVIAPQDCSFDQPPVVAPVAFLEDGRAVVEPVHPVARTCIP